MLNRSTLIRTTAFVAAATSLIMMIATNAESLDTTTFKPVTKEFEVTTGDKIEVAELFWFGCGHCYALEPYIKKWKANKPENAEFVKIPAIFSPRWEFHGRAFYTMQALELPDKAYDKFFHNIHIMKKPMNTPDSLVKLLADFDKTEEQVIAAFNSPLVEKNVGRAITISRMSGATGVPSIIVDGKYLTSTGLAKGTDLLFPTVDKLVEKASSER